MAEQDSRLTIEAAGAALRAGSLKAPQLVERCLERIEKLEPRLAAWVSVDPAGAMQAARSLQAEADRGAWRGALHGIPIGIKDIVDVAGWPTQAGSLLRRDHRAAEDAPLVANLRAAGAIILGKTVTTEFASFDPPPTCNPWNLDRTPGGSSSGSAAAVAAGMCLGAVGSQTGGSITRPASFCGVAGCKPTWGRVDTHGVVPLAYHLDHPGPMARTAGDLAILLTGMLRVDEAAAVAIVHHTAPPKLGVIETYFNSECSPAIGALFERALDRLRKAGATLNKATLPAPADEIIAHHLVIMQSEGAEYHRPWYPARRAVYGPRIGELLEGGNRRSAVELAAALAHQRAFHAALPAMFSDAEVVITPSTVTTAPPRDTTGDPRFNAIWSYSGLPTISIPCGLADDGLPGSVQFIGRPGSEGKLLGIAAWCETQFDFQGEPQL